ncbi:MAG TPA: TetR/AcrR family transcriptional regulator [Burkholderiales bacterium]|nr:TetR/AcrR family transcriptional regulator [Burkholderiales bacterium]
MAPNPELRERIVDVAVQLAERRSWEAVRLYDVAAAAGLTLDDIRAHFREKEDLVDAWFDRADRAMLMASESADFLALSTRERLHRLLMTWVGALAAHRRVTRQMIYGKLEPGHLHIQIPGLLRVSRTVQWMREAAHRDPSYLHRAIEEAGLTTIYLLTFFYWMHDQSAGSVNTRRFLDGLLGKAQVLSACVFFGRSPRQGKAASGVSTAAQAEENTAPAA